MNEPSHNLPVQLTSFVGRERELAEVGALLDDDACRLLTLVGPGGIGKTRLAIKAAAGKLQDFHDGTHFIALQSVNSADKIVPALASLLKVESYEASDLERQLLRFLSNKNMLLLMDNFEHLLGGVGIVAAILESCPDVKVVATSRAPLNLPAEWLFHLEGLIYAGSEQNIPVETYDALRLFDDRARRVRHDFSLDAEQNCVMRVCQLLEGMPLGIELAAAWIKNLSCSDIAAEIGRNIDFLATDAYGVPDRHRSMRAVFEHSWPLLTEAERDAFMKVAVFRGGFRREAAEWVTGASLQTLSGLVDKSLLKMNSSGRYEVHELLRQYGEEKLVGAHETAELVRDRHCEYCADFLSQRKGESTGPRWPKIAEEIEEEIDNMRAAWSRAIEYGKLEAIGKMLTSLDAFYIHQEWYEEGEIVLRQAAEALQTDEPTGSEGVALGVALAGQGAFLQLLGRGERSTELMEQGLAVLREVQAPPLEMTLALDRLAWKTYNHGDFQTATRLARELLDVAAEVNDINIDRRARAILAIVARLSGRYGEAKRLHQEMLRIARENEDRYVQGTFLGLLGELAQEMGDYAEAKELVQESLAIIGEFKNQWPLGHQHEIMGHVDLGLGNYTDAGQHLEESLTIAREVGDPRRITFSLVSLGDWAIVMGDLESARRYFQEGNALSTEASQLWQRAWSLRGLGQVALATGDYVQASRYQQEGLAYCRRFGWRLGIASALNELGKIAVASGNTTGAWREFHGALEIGLQIELRPLILNVLTTTADLFRRQGEVVQAVESLALVLQHPCSQAYSKTVAERLLATLRNDVEPTDFASALERGQTADLKTQAAAVLEHLASEMAGQSQQASQPLAEPLTARELEVLRLLDAGLSNREIAQELVIALGTAKTHVHRICGKLDAPNRRAAVARAQELGLL